MRKVNTAGPVRAARHYLIPAQTAREDVARAMRNILNRIARQARMRLGDTRTGEIAASLEPGGDPDGVLEEFLTLWCEADARPLVLLLDEIAALVGDSLIAVPERLERNQFPCPT